MRKVNTITCFPPQIIQYFNSALLSMPTPRFFDSSETLWSIYEWIMYKLFKKAAKNPLRLDKFKSLEKEFMELYGRAVAKEKEVEAKTGKSLFRSYYRIEGPKRNGKRVSSRLRCKYSPVRLKYRANSEV